MNYTEVATWNTNLSTGHAIAAMTVSAQSGGRYRRMSRFFNRVVAVPTIQFQLAGVQFVTERNRLLRLMADIDDVRMDRGKQTGCQITTDRRTDQDDQDRELVNPSWKMKLLHSIHLRADPSKKHWKQ